MKISRRKFISRTSAVAGSAALGLSPFSEVIAREIATGSSARTLVGYCYPWTARSGEDIDFMFSAYKPGEVEASLVRLICSDGLNDGMYKEIPMASDFEGTYEGKFQGCYPGSYVEVPIRDAFSGSQGFTVETHIFPTLLSKGGRRGDGFTSSAIEVKAAGTQSIVSHYDAEKGSGWSLAIDRDHNLTFIVADGDGNEHRATLDRKLLESRWFKIAGGYDAEKGSIWIRAASASRVAGQTSAWPEISAATELPDEFRVSGKGALRFAAATGGPGNGRRRQPVHTYSGKMDAVTIRQGRSDKLIGSWDYSKGIGTITVHDVSGNDHHGETVNAPERAITGVNHDLKTLDWKSAPEMYSAITFHSDSLVDAEWEPAFSYRIPDNLPNGIYAVKLVHAGKSLDHIPFYVAPKKGKPSSKAALLLPTFNNLAYSNLDLQYTTKRMIATVDGDGNRQVTPEEVYVSTKSSDVDNRFLQDHPEIGRGLYRAHDDGSQVQVTSMKFPNMTAKPHGILYTLSQDTYITDWLREKDIDVDILTDELLHEEGVELLNDYNVVMTGNHPEYYTPEMLTAVEDYIADGGRIMYMGGNGFYQVMAVHSELPGVVEVRRGARNPDDKFDRVHEFDGHPSGSWAANGRAPQRTMGVGFDGMVFLKSVGYGRNPDSDDPRAAFIFEGVKDRVIGDFGLLGGGAAGQEVDTISHRHGSPAHILHLARSQDFPDPVTESWGLVADKYRENFGMPHADITFYETAAGGGVFATGSMAWAGSLSHNDYSNNVSQITENVLRRFMDDEPIPMPTV